ncbi:MAG: BREX-2 system phosphatase PglZ [Isosphaerales bacterium]
MTTTAPTFNQIKAQVAAIRKKLPNARVIGILAPGRWAGERQNQDGEETYRIEQCDSPLAMRIALREERGPNTTTVLITGLDEKELSDDILVRLAKRRLFPIDLWQIIKSLFQAHAIDPRLTRHGWMADKLMKLLPDGGYPAATGGFLDAETVWPILLMGEIGLGAGRPDLLTILKWSIDTEAAGRFRSASQEFREAAVSWLSGLAGPTVEALFRCVQSNQRADALPIGLAAGVVFDPRAKGKLDRAAGKMEERFLGSFTPDDNTIERWKEAATEVVRLQITDQRRKGSILKRADEILQEVGAESHARLSPTSPRGFSQRLEAFGESLTQILESKRYQSIEPLTAARDEIGEHELAGRASRRLECVNMALRLVRWLQLMEQQRPDAARSLVEAAKYQVAEGGFADWARLTLRLGDPVRQLSEAYSTLFEHVTEVREAQSRHFAELLQSWIEADYKDDALIPVERVLYNIKARREIRP